MQPAEFILVYHPFICTHAGIPLDTGFHMFCKDMQEVRIILTVAYPTMMQCRRDAE